MTAAVEIITSAYQRCNRLSPGETLNADDAAFGFGRLNELVDELSAQKMFSFKGVITTATQTGNITLGAGAWAAISPGTEVTSIVANNLSLDPITMQQYNELYKPADNSTPRVWAWDGLSTVYLYPAPSGQTLSVLTRTTVSEFADQTTDYVLPSGWKAALSAALAVRVAPTILGKLPPSLLRDEKKCMGAVDGYEFSAVDIYSFTKAVQSAGAIIRGL